MIKRRFYKEEHGDKNDPSSDSSSSSSSSDSEVEAEPPDESDGAGGNDDDDDDDVAVAELKQITEESCSSSSGYESEDSSVIEIDAASSDFVNEDDGKIPVGPRLSSKCDTNIPEKEFSAISDEESMPADLPECVLKVKSVYKCRICPRIVCLTEETLRAHLSSKRHIRSEKLLKENRLKVMLNSDGELENQETPAEIHSRIVSMAQDKSKKKNKGRQRQRKRSRKKLEDGDNLNMEKASGSMNSFAKRRRKNAK